MEKINFLPQSYYNIYKQKKNRKYIVIFVILVILEVVILNIVLNNFNKYNRIKQKIANESIVLENLIKKSYYNTPGNVFKDINNLSHIKNDLLLKSNYKEVFIKESVIVVKLCAKDTGEYLRLIQKIENETKYNLIYVSPYEKTKNGYEFTIKMEVTAVGDKSK